MQKFDNLVKRLTNKVKSSATPVTGFVLGMSGTDSILTYILLNEVAKTEGFWVLGRHYQNNAGFFERETLPWIKTLNYKTSDVSIVEYGTAADVDQMRWGLLHQKAADQRYWVASTTNATEKALGTFSIMANSTSIAPIVSLYKSEVLEICKEFGVPEAIIQRSRMPDCICGRDEFAADHIELIDNILSYRYTGGQNQQDVIKAFEYIRETKKENDFKNRTPYNV